MMNVASLTEEPPYIPQLDEKETDDEPLERVRRSLNPDFVRTFDASGLPSETLREFVYALDHFKEMMGLDNFPAERLLTTPDVINYGDEALQLLSHRRNNPASRQGVAVNEAILEHLQQFLDYRYPTTICQVLRALRIPGVTVVLDTEPCFIGISYNSGHPHFGILTFQDMSSRVSTSIPFLLSRLEM